MKESYIIPQQQQLEKLGLLPIKLRGGLGQRPETWHLEYLELPGSPIGPRFHIKVPLLKGSRFHIKVPKVPHSDRGSTLISFQVPHRFHIKVQFNFPSFDIEVPHLKVARPHKGVT